MALKNVCSIPRSWSLEDYSRHTCDDGSHTHLSRSQVHDLNQQGLVVWLSTAATRREKSVVWILPHRTVSERRAHPGGSIVGSIVNTGLSYRIGEYHADAVRRRQPWAVVMLHHILMRQEPRQSEEA